MGLKFYVFVLFVAAIISCNRATAEINHDNELVSHMEQDSINQTNLITTDQMNFEVERREFGFNFWKLISIVSIVLNLIFFYFLRMQNSNKKKNNRAVEAPLESDKRGHSVERELTLSTKTQKVAKWGDYGTSEASVLSKTERDPDEADQKYEVELSVESVANHITEEKVIKEPKVFYAESVSETGVFINVSEKSNPYKSYFKFIVEVSNQEEAKFEVLDSEFILKQGSNAPDIYLYNACDPENSNQNFISEIVTIEKGDAQLVNGNWQIILGKKAKIKFQ